MAVAEVVTMVVILSNTYEGLTVCHFPKSFTNIN